MAKVWMAILGVKITDWKLDQIEVLELGNKWSAANEIFVKANPAERTAAITAECQRLFADLTSHMRYLKDRYLKSPPLQDEDFVTLLLKIPDSTKSPRGEPKAQRTAVIGRSGTAMLILMYKYAEGTESLANPHTDIKTQIRWGILPPPGIAPTGIELTKVPTIAEELPNVLESGRKKDIYTFQQTDSGKTAYFAIRISNDKGGYGPWCPIFHAIIP
jgi:hypothetical protein